MTTPSEEYRLIPLTQGQFAKVDVADYEWLSKWKWCATWNPSTQSFYAMRSVRIGPRSANRKRPVLMHREILGLGLGDYRVGDHIRHDTLDNRRSQLRIATRAENNRNRKEKNVNRRDRAKHYSHPCVCIVCKSMGINREMSEVFRGFFCVA